MLRLRSTLGASLFLTWFGAGCGSAGQDDAQVLDTGQSESADTSEESTGSGDTTEDAGDGDSGDGDGDSGDGDGDSGDGDGDSGDGDGDSGDGDGDAVQYEAQALPGGLDRIWIERTTLDTCIRLVLVYPLMNTTPISTPANWAVESMTFEASATCSGGGTQMTALGGSLSFGALDEFSLYPCTVSVEVQATPQGGSQAVDFSAVDVPVSGVTCT